MGAMAGGEADSGESSRGCGGKEGNEGQDNKGGSDSAYNDIRLGFFKEKVGLSLKPRRCDFEFMEIAE
jgi:hypothetical protein